MSRDFLPDARCEDDNGQAWPVLLSLFKRSQALIPAIYFIFENSDPGYPPIF
jgi:hypothetical protein